MAAQPEIELRARVILADPAPQIKFGRKFQPLPNARVQKKGGNGSCPFWFPIESQPKGGSPNGSGKMPGAPPPPPETNEPVIKKHPIWVGLKNTRERSHPNGPSNLKWRLGSVCVFVKSNVSGSSLHLVSAM